MVTLFAFGCSSSDDNQASEAQPQPAAPAPAAPVSEQWTVIKTWEGEGIKATESFETKSREWRITWESYDEPFENAGILQIFVYEEDGELPVTIAANKQGAGNDVSYVRSDPGVHYLEMNSANIKWKVTVEDKR